MNSKRPLTLMVIAVVLVAAVAPSALAAEGDALDVGVTQDSATGQATVTVTQNGTAVENATVNVTSDGTYNGTGEYVTGPNGTVTLDEPDAEVTVNVTATANGTTGTTTATLVPREDSLDVTVEQADDGSATVTVEQYGTVVENATVNVTSDGDYAGTGEYTTGPNGTVTLDQPVDAVTVNVTATYDDLTAETTADLDGQLDVSVEQAPDGSVVVTVTENGTAVENATVNVTANATYAGTGEYVTDANGTVTLSEPTESVSLNVTATADGDEASTSTTVSPVDDLSVSVEQADDGTATVTVTRLGDPVENASVNVTSESDYVGVGEYRTGPNGTVSLPAPAERVTVTVTAREGGDGAATRVELAPPAKTGPFGQLMSSFVHGLKALGIDGPLGHRISEFATHNNPSNQQGPPEHAAANRTANDSTENATETSAPGHSGEAHGENASSADDAPGKSGQAHGKNADDSTNASSTDDAPGKSGQAHGKNADDAGNESSADDAPGHSGETHGNAGGNDHAKGRKTEQDENDDHGNDGNHGNAGDEHGNAGGNDGNHGNAGGNGHGNGRGR